MHMTGRTWIAVLALVGACGVLAVAIGNSRQAEGPARPPAPVLPGLQPGGAVLLPNQWSLRPAGRHIPLGDFPVNLALHPDGKHLAVLHAGYGPHEVAVVDLQGRTPRMTTRITLD